VLAVLALACSGSPSTDSSQATTTSTAPATSTTSSSVVHACPTLARTLSEGRDLDDDHMPEARTVAAVLARAFRLLRPPLPSSGDVLAEVHLDRTRPEVLEPMAEAIAQIDGVVVLARLSPDDVAEEYRRHFPDDVRLIETLPLPLSPILRVGGDPAALDDIGDLLAERGVNGRLITPSELDAERERGVGAVRVMFDLVRPSLAQIGEGSGDISVVASELAAVELVDAAAVEAARPSVNAVLDHAEVVCEIEVAS
jgi:hypothetical protein